MSYKINKTNGELIVDLVDGQIDETSTDITLIGRNYKGFGEKMNENFVKLMENFAQSSAPGAPLIGQLWYDTSEQRLKVYTGDTFKTASGALVSQTQPNLVTGDIWIDSFNNKLYFYDGADIVLVGPQYNAGQGKTLVEATTIIDRTGQDQTVLFMYISGLLTGIYSRTEFRPQVNITGYPIDQDDTNIPQRQIIRKGFNPVDTAFSWQGSARSTQSLISVGGEEFSEANFMKTDRDTSTTGKLDVKNAAGITVGVSDTVYANIKIDTDFNNLTAFENQQKNKDFVLRVKRGNAFDDVLYANASIKRTGIYTNSPSVGFDVNTDARIQGDFTVEGNFTANGNTTFISAETLQVNDKNIELATDSSGNAGGNDVAVDGGGVTLKSTDGDKTFNWVAAQDAWTSSEHIDLASTKTIKIDGATTLSANRLHNSVLYAEGLVSVGVLQQLTVDNLSIDGSAISTTLPMSISSQGTITVNDQKIIGVSTPLSLRKKTVNSLADPVDPGSSVASKEYVDEELKAEPLIVSLDVTGYSNPSASLAANGPYNNVKTVLDELYSASDKTDSSIAKIYCTSYSTTSVTGIDVDQLVDDPSNPGGPQISAVRKTFISVDKDGNASDESVLQDVDFLPVSASAGLIPERAIMEFENQSGVWTWIRTTVLS